MSSKILVALLVLLGMPLLGQLVGLFLHDVDTHNIAGLLGESALAYGSWLGMAAVIAALTRDLRTFLLALVLGTLGLQALGFLLNPSMTPGPPPPLLVPIAIVVGMLLVLAHQYTSRDVRRGIGFASVLAVGSIVLPLVVPRSGWSVVPASDGVPAHLRLVGISIDGVQPRSNSEASVQFRLKGVSPFYDYALVSPVVHLHTPDGSVISHAVENAPIGLNMAKTSRLRLPDGFAWIGERSSPEEFTSGVVLDLSEAQAVALSRGGVRLVLQGQIEVRKPQVMADLPLAPGATEAHNGRRIRIVGVERAPVGPSIEVHKSAVSSSRSPDDERLFSHRRGEPPLAYVLVNREQKEAIALNMQGASGSSFGLVLPGPRVWAETIRLQRLRHFHEASPAPIDEEWLKRARLLFVKWTPMGSYPVVINAGSPGAARFKAVGDSAAPRVRAVPQREPAAEP